MVGWLDMFDDPIHSSKDCVGVWFLLPLGDRTVLGVIIRDCNLFFELAPFGIFGLTALDF